MAKSVVEFFQDEDNLEMIDNLIEAGVRITNKYQGVLDLRLKGQSFVLTGTLETMSREQAQAKLKELGAKTPNSVSKNTTFVVVGENPGSKADKAMELGVTILNEQELISILKGE